MTHPLHIINAGLMPYQPAWDLQLDLHQRVLSGELPAGALMLVEHPPVITVGRRADAQRHLLASPALLESRGIQLIETDRGGDITFHGPGQLVAYPILNLNLYKLNLHAYLRLLEDVIIQTLAPFQIAAVRSCAGTGVWVDTPDGLAKICAIGIKLRRWVTLHGLALNVSTDLSFFRMINPCGLSKPVTSIEEVFARRDQGMTGSRPGMDRVRSGLIQAFQNALNLP